MSVADDMLSMFSEEVGDFTGSAEIFEASVENDAFVDIKELGRIPSDVADIVGNDND